MMLIRDIDKPWDDNNLGEIETDWAYENLEGFCLFSRLENRKGLVRVWLYFSDVKSEFSSDKGREEFAFWIEPDTIAEVKID